MNYIYGGAFDPPTIAHLNIMKAIHKHLNKTDNMYIAVSNNDEKQYKATIENRIKMVENLVHEKFKVNTPNIVQQNNRMLGFIIDNFNKEVFNEITICVGEDEWNSLIAGKWVNSQILLKNFKFLIVGRENTEIDIKNYNATVINIDNCKEISSSKVRDVFYMNPETHYKEVNKFITHQIFDYINHNKLYKQNGPDYYKELGTYLKNYAVLKKKNNWGEPSVTTDTVAYNGNKILLIRRGNFPYKNYWALPGGFFEKTDIDVNYGAARELKEETTLNLNPKKFEQIKTYASNFDPRMKIVDVAFAVRVNASDMKNALGSDDAAEARWFDLDNLPALAFHHKTIIEDWMKSKN